MDFSYENNKGLHAFFLSLVLILGIFTLFAPVKSYAADKVYPSDESLRSVLQTSLSNSGVSYSDPKYKEYRFRLDYKDGSTGALLVKADKPVKLVQTADKLAIVAASDVYADRYVEAASYWVRLDSTGKQSGSQTIALRSTHTHSFNPTIVGTYDSFTLRLPPKPFPGELAVKEMPGILVGQTGTIVLVGCLILGMLLTVGSVRRLISSFTR